MDWQLAMTDVSGWPSLALEVWQYDIHGRNELVGLCLCRLPSAPGEHVRECAAWRPSGTAWEAFVSSCGGPLPSLKRPAAAFTLNADRSELSTSTAGSIVVECRVTVKEMARSGVVLQPTTAVETSLMVAAVARAYRAARAGKVFAGDEEPAAPTAAHASAPAKSMR